VQYTVDNIDTMRVHVAILLDPALGSWSAEYFERNSLVIEDRLRTYMAAGVTVQDLGREVKNSLLGVKEFDLWRSPT
jgi:hypothetical protein